jgi:hypothetical protein
MLMTFTTGNGKETFHVHVWFSNETTCSNSSRVEAAWEKPASFHDSCTLPAPQHQVLTRSQINYCFQFLCQKFNLNLYKYM